MKVGLYHTCILDDASDVGLLKEKKGVKAKIRNFTLGLTLISEKNTRARVFYRSLASIYFERRRHLESKYVYVIHPFSLFRVFWESYMVLVFLVSLTMLPLNLARNMEQAQIGLEKTEVHVTFTHGLLICCDIFCLIDVGLRCFTGYLNPSTKEVYLSPKKIFWFYFERGAFACDFLTSTPYQVLRYGKILPPRLQLYLFVLVFFKVIRARTLFQYAKQMFSTWQLNTILFKLLWYVLMSALILHWGACVFIIIPQLINLEYKNTTTSWISTMPNQESTDANELYKMALFLAASSFLCTAYTARQIQSDVDIIISIIMSFTGYIMCIYIFVMMLLMVLSSNTPATKYQSIMSQLSEYMRHRQLPIALQHRLVQYYMHRFRQTYFRESAIMPILSERLQTEINHHCYTALVESVSILHDLPDDTVSEIVSNLKSEIYLPNDILVKAGTEGDCMYFIASGTVAVSTPTGREVCHLQDGGYFGEIALIRKDHKRIANVVAIEMVEVYKLDSKIFKKCLAELPDTYKRLEKISQDRYNRTNFLEELHKKHILEKALARKHEID